MENSVLYHFVHTRKNLVRKHLAKVSVVHLNLSTAIGLMSINYIGYVTILAPIFLRYNAILQKFHTLKLKQT